MRNIKMALLLLSVVTCAALPALSASVKPTPLPLSVDSYWGPHPDEYTRGLDGALLAAALNGNIPEAKWLLFMGADVNVLEDLSKNFTPLTFAGRSGKTAMVLFLLAQGANPNGTEERFSPLFWTIAAEQDECVKILLKYGADPQRPVEGSNLPIDYAAEDGDVDIVKMLIAYMPNLPRWKAHVYLKQAKNVDLNKDVEDGTLSDIREDVTAGADVNALAGTEEAGECSPLMRATFRGSLPMMKYLLAHGAQVDLLDERGRTALMYTGRTNIYYNIVMHDDPPPAIPLDEKPTLLLLRHGAEVDVRDKSGMTALMYAAQGNPKAATLLVARGAPVNANDNNGRTALHWAAAMRDEKSLALLLAHGLKVNVQDSEGETALMLASVMPDPPVKTADLISRRKSLELLRRFGASAGLKDKQGHTAADYAKSEDAAFIGGS